MDDVQLAARGLRRRCRYAENLLFAFLGVLLGTAVGVLPGIGPAMTVALLLPLTTRWSRRRRSSCSPASTTAACTGLDDDDPAQHTGRVRVGHHRHRGQPDGQARAAPQALATAAIGSFVAGTIATFCLALLAPWSSSWPCARPAGLLRAHGGRLRRRDRCSAPRSAAWPRSLSAWPSA